ncbi:MAG: hypothetical protein PHS41_05510, partial [Victivallaceae bacterium]|nr:hypothetical protein [Victivallaceae bacterium]
YTYDIGASDDWSVLPLTGGDGTYTFDVHFILLNISWFNDVMPVMLDRAPGESFLNPMDIQSLRDFNMFALIVTIMGSILNRSAWIGNDTTSVGKNPHEQKMAGILGTWRNGFAYVMLALVGIFVITFMMGGRFAGKAHEIRIALADKVAEEVFDENVAVRNSVVSNVKKIPVEKHQIGTDQPYSRDNNPDKAFMATTLATVHDSNLPDGNAYFQEFRSLYNQMMMPVMLRKLFPPVMMGIFSLLMVMLLLSTDDSRIFNASSTIIQDVVLPLKKVPMSTEQHLKYLKICTLSVTIFFFVVSLFFAQLDYINMFVTIMCAVWTGAAGPIMVGGFYTRWGNTVGAWCALIFGSGTSIVGLFCQRNWADRIYPWLANHGYANLVGEFLEQISGPFNPYIIWRMDPIKFPINSYEVYFIAMILGIFGYIAGSLLTYRRPFNLDRLYHRGVYSDNPEADAKRRAADKIWTFGNLYNKLIGIDSEYTTGDKVIAWSVFIWSVVYTFGIMFVGVFVWNMISPWPARYWGIYFFITTICAALIVGVISTVWFFVGGMVHLRQLFIDLEKRVANPLDNGSVSGHVSLADKARFDAIDRKLGTEDDSDDTTR